MNNFYIFLDVDGVLNRAGTCGLWNILPKPTKERTPDGFIGVEQKYISILRAVYDRISEKGYDVHIILSSDWKRELTTDECNSSEEEKKSCILYNKSGADVCYLMDNLAEQDLHIEDKTPDLQFGSWKRGDEILRWLSKHQISEASDNYLIFDDNEFDFTEHEVLAAHVLMTGTIAQVEHLDDDYYTDISEDICNFINENYRGLLNGKEKVNDDYERDE